MGKLVVANWKMNPGTAEEAVELAEASDEEGVVVASPFVFLQAVGAVIKKAALGAQDLFWEDKGAFTGGVSGSQLKELGVKYVIIGHSERRRLGDTDEIVAKKTAAALRNGLIPIVCIGETREEKQAGKSKEAIERQLRTVLAGVTGDMRQGNSSMSHVPLSMPPVIVYEPVWAISTEPGAEADTPENAVSMIQFMKTIVPARFIYGGSVNANNAESFLKKPEIEGALVGGASLKKEDIKKIVETAKKY